jgi:Ser-tRNA(Ala) deacylase AlaX
MNELAPVTEFNSLTKVINETGVEFETAEMIQKKFSEFYEEAERLKKEALEIKVTDISQKDEMKSAREIRLELKEIRVKAEWPRVKNQMPSI